MKLTIEEVRTALAAAQTISLDCAVSRGTYSIAAEAGRRRRGRRIALGMTLGDLAEAAGVRVSYVSDLERGVHVPDGACDAIDAVLHRGCPGCSPSGTSAAAMFSALCDEWIAARTVRWDGTALMAQDQALGWIYSTASGLYGVEGPHPSPRLFPTEPEARAWLEEQARAAGFEVSK